MEHIEEYRRLPRALRHQLSKIQSKFYENKEIQRHYQKMVHGFKDNHNVNDRISTILFRMSIFRIMGPKTLIIPELLDSIYCYHDNKDKSIITFNKVLKTGKHAKVAEGLYRDRPVIIKWYQSNKRDITYELNIYKKLKDIGCDVPWFSGHYNFWGHKVMILEKLSPLCQYDDELKLGVQIIQQLHYLHKFAIHCDIKPQNIMKRQTGNKCNYLLIDFGGVAIEHLSYGYRRWLWSPKWTSQKAHQPDQVVTQKNDFIELGYTMKAIQNWRDTHNHSDGEIKTGYSGRLLKYMKRVEEIDHKKVTEKDYSDLIKILTR